MPQWILGLTSDNCRYLTGAEGLVVVMFWLDYLREFCFAHNGIWAWDVWISSPVVKHYAQWVLVFIPDNVRYFTLVQRDWWLYCYDWNCERISFCSHWDLNWGPQDLKCCTLLMFHNDFWFSFLAVSVVFLWGRGIGDGIFMTGTLREFHFAYIGILTGDLWISNPAPYKCVTVTSGFDNFRYLTLVQRHWWC